MLNGRFWKRFGFLAILIIFTVTVSVITFCSHASARNISSNKQIEIINKYQKEYFTIVKRNNMFLQFENTDTLNADRKELDNLFAEVEQQITNKNYLKKYKKIQKRFSDCNGENTIEINEFADKNYKAINKLLNKVYRKAESDLSYKASKELALSQLEWENEVEDYKKVYDSMGFGTIGASIYYEYEINMREFRTLLLMLLL